MAELTKFYAVTVFNPNLDKMVAVQSNIIDWEKAERVAKKAVDDYRGNAYILTPTHVVKAPELNYEVVPITQ